MKFSVKVSNTIPSSQQEIYNTIVSAEKLSKFFTSKSSGNLIPGSLVKWYWADCDVFHNVKVTKLENPSHIQFEWDATGQSTLVDIQLKPKSELITKVLIEERHFSYAPIDVNAAMEQTQGWTDFLCSLKIYLHNGVQLRKL